MKRVRNFFRALVCAGLLAALAAAPALAADQAPEKQGDFYVLVNGQYLTFPDAAPQLRDGRSFLPFAAVFSHLGFSDVRWDGDSGTVTAVKPDASYAPANGGQTQTGDLTVELTIGSKVLTYQYANDLLAGPDGQLVQAVHTVQMDAAPYLSQGRTYVPLGLVAGALGYHVGWDAVAGAVIIDDVDALLAANTESYTLMDQYLEYSRAFAQGNWRVTGAGSMDMALQSNAGGRAADATLRAEGEYEMLTSGNTAFEFDGQAQLDMAATLNGEDATGLLAAESGLSFPLRFELSLRGDLAQGGLYFRLGGDQLSQLTGWDPALWYHLDLKSLFDQTAGLTGMDHAQMLALSNTSQSASFADTLEMILRAAPLTSVQATTADYLALYNAMFGDSAFEKSGSSYVNSFLAAEEAQGSFTLYTTGGKVDGYAIQLRAGGSGLSMELDASMREDKQEMSMGLSASTAQPLEDGSTATMSFRLGLKLDGTYHTTTQAPETEPPTGEAWVSLAGGSAPQL